MPAITIIGKFSTACISKLQDAKTPSCCIKTFSDNIRPRKNTNREETRIFPGCNNEDSTEVGLKTSKLSDIHSPVTEMMAIVSSALKKPNPLKPKSPENFKVLVRKKMEANKNV